MLRLIEWLDLRYIFGPSRPFMLRFGAFCFIVIMSSAIVSGMRNPERVVSRAPAPYLPHSDFARSESLFRGVKPVAQTETLAEAQRCLAQAIYFEARSEPVAGWEGCRRCGD